MRVEAPEWMCLRVSQRAVQLANEAMKGWGWSNEALSALQPMPGTGRAGMRTTAKYLIHQDRGIRPFVMNWVEGRAQTLTSRILTPSGWSKMGEMEVGDQVVDPMTGTSTTVIGVYPQGLQDVYRVTLSDGTCTEASGDHLWVVQVTGMRLPSYTWTTLKIKEFIERNKSRGDWCCPVRIPEVPSVQFLSSGVLPIPPYTMGALLGDGSVAHKRAYIHSVDQGVLDRIRGELPDSMDIRWSEGLSYRLVKRSGLHNPYIQAISELGLTGRTCLDKFIPDLYKRASVQDRVSLLQGLMDTDGHCDKQGRSEFCSISPQLIGDVREVLMSLGGRASLAKRPGARSRLVRNPRHDSYRLQNMNCRYNLFSLERKASRFIPRDGRKLRRIISVEHIGSELVQCIKVDADSGMYITDDFIPTHNTIPLSCKSGDGPHIRRGKDPGQPGWVNIPHVGRVWREQKWRHPGLAPRNFMENALNQAVEEIKPLAKQMLMQGLVGRDKTRTT